MLYSLSSVTTSYSRTGYGHVGAWGTTAQGVYRLGDTVQCELYVRYQSNERFVKAPPGEYQLRVFDPMDRMVHEETELELNAFGALDGEFRVAESGAVGCTGFRLMLHEQVDASQAASQVGYLSASQFSREYRRVFGAPPQRDVRRMQSSETVSGTAMAVMTRP